MDLRVDTLERDWNGEYQGLLSREDSYDKYKALSNLAQDFVYASKVSKFYVIKKKVTSRFDMFNVIYTGEKSIFVIPGLILSFAQLYAQVIISELCLPDERKTIKPKKMGGVAGGSLRL